MQTKKGDLQISYRQLEGPGVFQHLNLILLLVGRTIKPSNISYPHVLGGHLLPPFELQGSLYHDVETVQPIHSFKVGFESFHLADTVD
jgi:hypothetical protein